jgi:hypothetical protein
VDDGREAPYRPRTGTLEERFLARVDRNGECWLWTGIVKTNGYGIFSTGRRKSRVHAHRWSYEHFVGPIPEGLEIDHTCHDPATCKERSACPHRRCVNPAHLRAVTRRENHHASGNAEATSKAHRSKTHCPQGHPYDEANTRWHWNRTYWNRQCIECSRKNTREYMRRQAKIKRMAQDQQQKGT